MRGTDNHHTLDWVTMKTIIPDAKHSLFNSTESRGSFLASRRLARRLCLQLAVLPPGCSTACSWKKIFWFSRWKNISLGCCSRSRGGLLSLPCEDQSCDRVRPAAVKWCQRPPGETPMKLDLADVLCRWLCAMCARGTAIRSSISGEILRCHQKPSSSDSLHRIIWNTERTVVSGRNPQVLGKNCLSESYFIACPHKSCF